MEEYLLEVKTLMIFNKALLSMLLLLKMLFLDMPMVILRKLLKTFQIQSQGLSLAMCIKLHQVLRDGRASEKTLIQSIEI